MFLAKCLLAIAFLGKPGHAGLVARNILLAQAQGVTKINTTTTTMAPVIMDNDVRVFLEEQEDQEGGLGGKIDCQCDTSCPSVAEMCPDFADLLDKEAHDTHMDWDGKLEDVTQAGCPPWKYYLSVLAIVENIVLMGLAIIGCCCCLKK